MDEKQWVARHEAAHAVALVKSGLVFENVTIFHDRGEWRGCLERSEHLSDRRDEVVSQLAGYAAQIKISPEREVEAREGASRPDGDFLQADWFLSLVDDLTSEESRFEYWIERARQHVDENWRAIAAVAAELVQRETLTGREVVSLIQTADAQMDRQP